VPAHGSPGPLRDVLRSIGGTELPEGGAQVVVAVDGPDAALEEVARDHGVTLVVLPHNAGSYAARNAALDHLLPSIRWVLFTDTDCAVTQQWVVAHLEALEHAEASGGAVRITTSTPPRPAEWVDAGRHLRQEHFVTRLGFAATCNLAVRRDTVDALRFDATLRSGGDFDFGQRLRSAGGRLVYAPEAEVFHPARRSSRQVLRKVARVARGAAVNEARGYKARARRDPSRTSAAQRAQLEDLDVGHLWRVRVRALDAACSLVYARHVPSVVLPALQRRLRRLAPWRPRRSA
jgi:GT2 family glycosyltransferase